MSELKDHTALDELLCERDFRRQRKAHVGIRKWNILVFPASHRQMQLTIFRLLGKVLLGWGYSMIYAAIRC